MNMRSSRPGVCVSFPSHSSVVARAPPPSRRLRWPARLALWILEGVLTCGCGGCRRSRSAVRSRAGSNGLLRCCSADCRRGVASRSLRRCRGALASIGYDKRINHRSDGNMSSNSRCFRFPLAFSFTFRFHPWTRSSVQSDLRTQLWGQGFMVFGSTPFQRTLYVFPLSTMISMTSHRVSLSSSCGSNLCD